MRHLAPVTIALLLLFAVLAVPGRSPAAARATPLRGTVGPGFTIMLKTTQEKLVKKLTAGTYAIRIRDLSPIHNFHLFAPGVNKKTSVQNTGSLTWTVRLKHGVYRYRCDRTGRSCTAASPSPDPPASEARAGAVAQMEADPPRGAARAFANDRQGGSHRCVGAKRDSVPLRSRCSEPCTGRRWRWGRRR
jgi:hypothetical protein